MNEITKVRRPSIEAGVSLDDFRIFCSSETTSEAVRNTMASWQEIQASLQPSVREMAQEFVNLCLERGAFNTDPPCEICVVDENWSEVMFDWNSGTPPIFTVVISTQPTTLSYSGEFKEEEMMGETLAVRCVEAQLRKLVREIGKARWKTPATLDSSWGQEGTSLARLRYTSPPRTWIASLSLRRIMPATKNFVLPDSA